MKWEITSRLELLLAKIAGHDVSLETMTPPVASNATEELLLEIANVVKASVLPDVTADDDGSVLTVVDGEWVAATASGGGGCGLDVTWFVKDLETTVVFNEGSEQNEIVIPRTVEVSVLEALVQRGASCVVVLNGVCGAGALTRVDYLDVLQTIGVVASLPLVKDQWDQWDSDYVTLYQITDSPNDMRIHGLSLAESTPVTVSIGYMTYGGQLVE